jgi:uncharacterized protein
MQAYASIVAAKLQIKESGVKTVLELLSEGATIPFIARYRKDKTGALDEVQIAAINEMAIAEKQFAERKLFIEKTIHEQGKLSDELKNKLNKASSLSELEDIYLPYKPKRKTKAQTARENGLEPLAQKILEQSFEDTIALATPFLNEQVSSTDDALTGAKDIIAEMINENAEVRGKMRQLFQHQAQLQSTVWPEKENEAIKYKDYFNFSEAISKIPSHRILAIMRGFTEGVLKMNINPIEEDALSILEKQFIKNNSTSASLVKKGVKDAYRRLMQPALETEFRNELKTKADEEAINVFAENLRQLLLSSPLGSKRILAIDPGYRTGCKVVCLDEKGDLIKTDLFYIHEPGRLLDAEHRLRSLVKEYSIQAIAIGDGTAGRESEQFIKKLQLNLPIFLVNEDGASIYSASETARNEFPDHDITVRGAVSIGRRLMDPLAELVKIDPKSIGVGQYQHDVNQPRLKEKLDQTVISCVNLVGVNLNTASKHLLSYVSGIGPSIAENIVNYRKEKGRFNSRKDLLKVPRLGDKAFEQCAGFLRISNGAHPLDASAVHPEAYELVNKMATDQNLSVDKLIGNESVLKQINIKNYISDKTGIHTLTDIIKELQKPGLDPREDAQEFEYADIFSIEDVKVGMVVPGMVSNLTRFGAFIDIGVKQDGLVHVSEISHTYITDPSQVLKLKQKVMVKVTEVDIPRKRIALSIKQTQEPAQRQTKAPTIKPMAKTPAPENTFSDALNKLRNKFEK